jgi:hypothetical protein
MLTFKLKPCNFIIWLHNRNVVLYKEDVKNLNAYVITALIAKYFPLILSSSVFHINLVANFAHNINCRRINFRTLHIKHANKSAVNHGSHTFHVLAVLYELEEKVLCADHVDLCVCPFVWPGLTSSISDKALRRTFIKFCKGLIYKMLRSHREDDENRLTDSLTSFKGVNNFVPLLPTSLDWFGWNSAQKIRTKV